MDFIYGCFNPQLFFMPEQEEFDFGYDQNFYFDPEEYWDQNQQNGNLIESEDELVEDQNDLEQLSEVSS